MKIYSIVRTVVFYTLTVLTLVFLYDIPSALNCFIGALIAFYGLDEILLELFRHEKHFSVNSLYWNLVEIIIGFTLLFFVGSEKTDLNLAIVCVSWATWSILRETRELVEATHEFKTRLTAIPNIVESLVVIAFSVTMIVSPTEHHVIIHLYLLSVELFTKVSYHVIDQFKKP